MRYTESSLVRASLPTHFLFFFTPPRSLLPAVSRSSSRHHAYVRTTAALATAARVRARSAWRQHGLQARGRLATACRSECPQLWRSDKGCQTASKAHMINEPAAGARCRLLREEVHCTTGKMQSPPEKGDTDSGGSSAVVLPNR